MFSILIALLDHKEENLHNDQKLIEQYCAQTDKRIHCLSFTEVEDLLRTDISSLDAVFLDMDIQGMNTIQLAERIRKENQDIDIICMTSLPEMAMEGYQVSAFGFLLRPISFATLSDILDKIVSQKKNDSDTGSFFIKTNGILKKFNNEEVLFIEMEKHDVVIHSSQNNTFHFRGSIKGIEPLLDTRCFVKINSGIIINITKMKKTEDGNVILESGDRLPISRSRKKEFSVRLSEYYVQGFKE